MKFFDMWNRRLSYSHVNWKVPISNLNKNSDCFFIFHKKFSRLCLYNFAASEAGVLINNQGTYNLKTFLKCFTAGYYCSNQDLNHKPLWQESAVSTTQPSLGNSCIILICLAIEANV